MNREDAPIYSRKHEFTDKKEYSLWYEQQPEHKRRKKILNIARTYRITVDQAEKMIDSSCEICGSSQHIRIDHNHSSGAVRGSLCQRCNLWLAALEDRLFVIEASRYLARHTDSESVIGY